MEEWKRERKLEKERYEGEWEGEETAGTVVIVRQGEIMYDREERRERGRKTKRAEISLT